VTELKNVVQELQTSLVDYSAKMLRDIDGQAVNDLKLSIKQYGILQPILVRKKGDGRYEVVCGNHRLCAARGLELDKVPVIVRTGLSDYNAVILALQENTQRLSMDPVKEGEIYSGILSEKFSLRDIEQLASLLGKSTAYVKARVDVFRRLHQSLRVEIGKRLTLRSAVALTRLSPNQQLHVFEKVEQNRELEEKRYLYIKGFGGGGGFSTPSESERCVCPKCGAKHWRHIDTCRFQMTC
jgi:ParB family chromosome partitioning protein